MMAQGYGYRVNPTSGNEWQLAYRKSPNENPERSKIFFLKLDTQIQCQKRLQLESIYTILF